MPVVFRGIEQALKFLGNAEVYIHINENYFNELKPKIFEYINNYRWHYKFHLSIENPCYVGGEASALMNIIENGIAQPRPRIHRTVVKGLFDRPTMMQNVETFYDVARILDDTYDYSRFSCIYGDGVKNECVLRHGIDANVADILRGAGINPNFDYYVQIGGSASGSVYNKNQLGSLAMSGVGAVEIFDSNRRDFLQFIRRLGDFYRRESCGKCKGREFATALDGLIKTFETEQQAIKNIANIMTFVDDMNKKTFCGLCKSLRTPIVTYCSNILGINLE
jgi:NADH:ubiquinone oxidoreductase subunit F (NADH-binding)